jgi:hypothetical protein
MGGDFYIKAVTRYAVLVDVFLFFLFSNKKTCFKKFSNFFFRFGFWAEGLGMNAQNQKLLIIFFIPFQFLKLKPCSQIILIYFLHF